MSTEEQIVSKPCFGQFGKITKVSINFDQFHTNPRRAKTLISAYITFEKDLDASLALLAVQNQTIGTQLIKASFGMTKYCSFYLARMDCQNIDCAFFHGVPQDGDCILKVDLKERCGSGEENQ